MAKKQFKAQSKRVIDLMINSIYTHKEIFLREIISNASDAIDKLYFRSLTDSEVGKSRSDFFIEISADKDSRTLCIRDNGIGMTQEELKENLGVIAKSGSFSFKEENKKTDDVDIIGQFGVGFYSAFMVSDEVTVLSRAFGSDKAYEWKSTGSDGYTIEECEKDEVGTTVSLKLKADTDEEQYSQFLEEHQLRYLIKKYSDYVRYPIKMETTKHRKKDDSDEWESYTEVEIINSMVPIWRRKKTDENKEEFNAFYKEKFMDYEDPLRVILSSAEGAVSYKALLYFPSHTPYDYYTKEYEKGLQLYASGVMIMEKCAELLPDYFSFVKGLVDSEDISLNISRETLQHDRQLKLIAKNIEKKIKNELAKMLEHERENYEKFFKQFGLQLKAGVYTSFGANKEELQDLLLFYSTFESGLVTLKEYTDRMPEGQDKIYYACGSSLSQIKALPQMEGVLEKGYEVLCLTDSVDEFCLKAMVQYGEKQFCNISSGEFDLQTEKQKEESKKLSEENRDLLSFIKETLSGKVEEVKLSQRLQKSAVCLSTKGEVSIEMEKVLNAMPTDRKVKAERVLEINPTHKVFSTLKNLYQNDKERLKECCFLLYEQAGLMEGILPEDPVKYSERVFQFLY